MKRSIVNGPAPRNQVSFSRVKTLNQCPQRYRLRYLKGIPEGFRSIESFLGGTVHEVLEWLYGERDHASSPTAPAALERFAERWRQGWTDDVAVVRLDSTADDLFRLGETMIDRFVRDTFVRDHSETVALEHRLTRRLSPDIVFTGFADRIGRTRGGRLFVVDYKSSRRLGDSSDLSEGLQAPLYAACAMEQQQSPEALAGYHYLRHGVTRWQTITSENAQRLVQRFLAMAEQALATTELPTRPGPLCSWCGYNSICTAAEVPESTSGGLRHTLNRHPLLAPGKSEG